MLGKYCMNEQRKRGSIHSESTYEQEKIKKEKKKRNIKDTRRIIEAEGG